MAFVVLSAVWVRNDALVASMSGIPIGREIRPIGVRQITRKDVLALPRILSCADGIALLPLIVFRSEILRIDRFPDVGTVAVIRGHEDESFFK